MLEAILTLSLAGNVFLLWLWATSRGRYERDADYRTYAAYERADAFLDRLQALMDPEALKQFKFWTTYAGRAQAKFKVDEARANAAAIMASESGKPAQQRAREIMDEDESEGGGSHHLVGQGPSLLP